MTVLRLPIPTAFFRILGLACVSLLLSTDAASAADATDAGDVRDTSIDATDTAVDVTDATDAADSTDATDVADSTDATDVADSTDATDVADSTDPSDTPIPNPTIVDFTLVDAASDAPIAVYDPLPAGATINLAKLPSKTINLRANTDPETVGSVRFDLNDMRAVEVDDVPPYAMMGDTEGDYADWTPEPGTYTVLAKPFSEAGAAGIPGRIGRVQFDVIDAPDKNAVPAVVIETPERGDRKSAPASFDVVVKAGDIDGTVERVDLGVNPGPTASTTRREGRWRGTIGPLPAGRHTIEAVALDDAGDIGIGRVRVRVTPGSGTDAGPDPDTTAADTDASAPDATSDATGDTGETDAIGDTTTGRDLADPAAGDAPPDEEGCTCASTGPTGLDPSLLVVMLLVVVLGRRPPTSLRSVGG